MAASQGELAVRHGESEPPVDGTTAILPMPSEVVKVCSQFDPKLEFVLTFSVKPVMVDAEASSDDTRDASGNVRSNENKKVDCGREGRDLPDEVLERIIARMPFPFLFKARVLSRKWYFKFPLASQLARSFHSGFQTHVNAMSCSWTTYCPIAFSPRKEIVGFDGALSRWRPVLSFSYLDFGIWSCISCAGPLVCLISEVLSQTGLDEYKLIVSNVLTKSFRILQTFYTKPHLVRLALGDSQAYKVFVVANKNATLLSFEGRYDDDREERLHVYDSECRAWSTRSGIPNLNLAYFFENAAYVDGKMYGMGGHPDKCLRLWSFHVADNFWSHILDRFDLSCGDGGVGALVRCGERVMVCICSASAMLCQGVSAKSLGTSIIYTCQDSIRIFRLDLESLLLNEVCTGPPQVMASLCGSTMCAAFLEPMRISSDAKFLYFSWDGPDSPVVLKFDLQSLKWGHLPTAGSDCRSGFLDEHKIRRACSFQPGLNPFVMV